jgi:hypothetical protein
MSIVLNIAIGVFFGTWSLCFLPQIRLFFPKRIPFAPAWAEGVAILCFCALRCKKDDYPGSIQWKEVSKHEFCHQLQQRFLSPLGFAFLYFGEMLLRRIFIDPDWKSAYWKVSWEKQARKYMKKDNNSKTIIS